MTPEHYQEIAKLRDRNLSPKQIARKLDLRPAEVSAVIQALAKSAVVQHLETGELPPLEHCLLNEDAARHLLDRRGKPAPSDQETDPGMAQIWVVRSERGHYWVSSFLTDYWCLGVKDTFGPRKMNRRNYEDMIRHATRQVFEDGFREITLVQAQAIVFGAVDYASKCGLSPHRNFERSKSHLGDPPRSLPKIQFGHKGKPFYMSGPRDNSAQIINTLRKNLGEGNFHYLTPIG